MVEDIVLVGILEWFYHQNKFAVEGSRLDIFS